MDSKKRLASRIEAFRLEETGEELLLCPLSARERGRLMDTYRVIDQGGTDHQFENVSIQAQAFIIARGLVTDREGTRKYQDSEMESIPDDFLGEDIDSICERILVCTSMMSPLPILTMSPATMLASML